MALTDVLKNLSKQKKIVCACAVAAIIAAVVIGIVVSRSNYLATTMRLLRIEGTVSIEDSKGSTKPVMDNLRFQSGDALNTGDDGLASVGLDEHKIITLQNDSRAEFKKKSKHLELKLTKGAVFFNVAQKLRADETFEIKTSTMTAGIRGTSGMVYYDAQDGGRESLLITDGSVEVAATNPETGETKTAMVEAGQEIKVYLFFDRMEDSVAFELTNVSESELPAFVAKRIAENDDLAKRVCNANNWNKDDVKKKAAETESTTTEAPKTEPTATTTTTTTTNTEATTTTTETTESTTVTESTTAKPTSTPTPKPKATSTPKPTPTKKPTPKVTETSAETSPEPSAESTPETAAETTAETSKETTKETTEATTKPTSSDEPTPPSGYSKWLVWGESTGDRGKYICSGSDYLGYDDGKWVKLTRTNQSTQITTIYKFTREDGSTYHTYTKMKVTPTTTTTTTKATTTTTTTKATSSVPSLPNGYSKVSQGWGVTYNGATVYVCQLTDHSVSGSEYLGYEGGKWINLSYSEQKSGRYMDHLYKKSDNSVYFSYDTKLY